MIFWPVYCLWCASWLAYNFATGAPAWESAVQAFFLGVGLSMIVVKRWIV